MPEIVEPETGQPCFLRQGPPSRPPAIDVLCRVKPRDVVIHHFLPTESEFRNECGEDVVRLFRGSEGLRPCKQAREDRTSNRCQRDDTLPGSSLALADGQRPREQVN